MSETKVLATLENKYNDQNNIQVWEFKENIMDKFKTL